jgi:hypothetical protein
MKITFEIDPHNSEDEITAQRYMQSTQMYLCLVEFAEHLRKLIKYEDLPTKELELAERIRSEFYSILDGNGVDIR